MGWSCGAGAAETMRRLQEAHTKEGCFSYLGKRYFFEPSRREHTDGAITGQVLRHEPKPGATDGTGFGYPVGSFRIEPTGQLSRAPRPLRDLADRILTCECGADACVNHRRAL
jgi:hypothetical protein